MKTHNKRFITLESLLPKTHKQKPKVPKISLTQRTNNSSSTFPTLYSPNVFLKSNDSKRNLPYQEPLKSPRQKVGALPDKSIQILSSSLLQRNSISLSVNASSNNMDQLLNFYSALKVTLSEYSIEDHKSQLLESLKLRKKFQAPSLSIIKSKSVFLQKPEKKSTRKTIIFDLDETLIHCIDSPEMSQVQIMWKLSAGEELRAGLLVRPYAIQCLQKASELFEVIIFTAANKRYANGIIDYLDPNGILVDHRLFQESCVGMNGVFLKDLRIFVNRKMRDLILVDNSIFSFLIQPENAVPITSWTGEHFDKKLLHVINIMDALSQAHDIRAVLERIYSLSELKNTLAKEPAQ